MMHSQSEGQGAEGAFSFRFSLFIAFRHDASAYERRLRGKPNNACEVSAIIEMLLGVLDA